LLATPLKQSQNFGTWDLSNHLSVDATQTYIDGLEWSGLIAHALNAALLAITKTCLGTKLRLYQTCILQVLLHGADTWTLLADDISRLQSFRMGCHRQLLGVKWQDHVKNTDIADMTGLPNIADIISKRRNTLFGHVVMDATTPAATTPASWRQMWHRAHRGGNHGESSQRSTAG